MVCKVLSLGSVGWLPVPLLVLGSFPVCVLSGFGAAPWFPVSFLGYRGGRHGSHSWGSGPV